jgi:hypothetical protein
MCRDDNHRRQCAACDDAVVNPGALVARKFAKACVGVGHDEVAPQSAAAGGAVAISFRSRSGLVQEQSGCMSICGNDLQCFSV